MFARNNTCYKFLVALQLTGFNTLVGPLAHILRSSSIWTSKWIKLGTSTLAISCFYGSDQSASWGGTRYWSKLFILPIKSTARMKDMKIACIRIFETYFIYSDWYDFLHSLGNAASHWTQLLCQTYWKLLLKLGQVMKTTGMVVVNGILM